MKTILLTGASGAVGSEILKQLAEKKRYKIRVFDLETARSKNIFAPYANRPDIELHYGDLTNFRSVSEACHEVDAVLHLGAVIPPLADAQPKLAHSVNTIGTQHIIKALEEKSPEAFLVYASSVSLYGDRVQHPDIYVTDPLIPSEGDEYARTKMAAEKAVISSQLSWTIFRLSAIMGIDNHKVSPLMFHMPLATTMEFTTAEDTARAFVNALEKRPELSGNIYNLGGGKQCTLTYEAFLQKNFQIFGLGKLNFAPKSFAEKNFHCGFYADGHLLENIVHFRSETVQTYFAKLEKSVSPVQRFFTRLVRFFVKKYLQSQSEPLQAWKNNDKNEIQRYFLTEK